MKNNEKWSFLQLEMVNMFSDKMYLKFFHSSKTFMMKNLFELDIFWYFDNRLYCKFPNLKLFKNG